MSTESEQTNIFLDFEFLLTVKIYSHSVRIVSYQIISKHHLNCVYIAKMRWPDVCEW